MKKIIFLYLSLGLPGFLWSQQTLKIIGNLKVNGNTGIVLKNTNWNNEGTFTPGNGTVLLRGDSPQTEAYVGGTNTTTFHNLEIDRTTNPAQLDQQIEVSNELRFTSGLLDLNGHDLILGEVNGQIVNESESNRIIGPLGGAVVKTTILNAPTAANPGNIGLEITSTQDLGSTEIRRGHDPKDILGLEGIERHFTISPTNNNNLDATARFYYFDAELNGLTENQMEPWRYDGTNWTNYARTAADETNNWVTTTGIPAFSIWTLGQGALKVSAKVILQGPYADPLMSDALRAANQLPTTEPYTGLGFTQLGGGGESISAGVFSTTGNDAIVDWILLELRDKNDATQLVRTQSALLQRDGDIVGLDGLTPVSFPALIADDYYLLVRHRNHLGVMTQNTLALGLSPLSVDLSNVSTPVYTNGGTARLNVNGTLVLIGGDANHDGEVNAADINNEWLLQNGQAYGYFSSMADINMDGEVNAVDYNLFILLNNSLIAQLPD
ncbi:MAG: dockerin type I domain-containing protein [Saprospiraceae bacterium]